MHTYPGTYILSMHAYMCLRRCLVLADRASTADTKQTAVHVNATHLFSNETLPHHSATFHVLCV